jgi:hypothetical protein
MYDRDHFTFLISNVSFPRVSDIKPAKNSAPKVSTPRPIRDVSFEKVPRGRGFLLWLAEMSRKRAFVRWLADYCRRSPRQLANLAPRYEIPRAGNGYNFDWGGNLDGLAKLIWDLRKFRKGNRKRRPKRRKRVSLLDQFSRSVHRAAWLTQIDKIEILQDEIRSAKPTRLRSLASSLARLSQAHEAIERRV